MKFQNFQCICGLGRLVKSSGDMKGEKVMLVANNTQQVGFYPCNLQDRRGGEVNISYPSARDDKFSCLCGMQELVILC